MTWQKGASRGFVDSEGQGEVRAVGSHALEQVFGQSRIAFALQNEPELAAQSCNVGRFKLRLEG